MGQVKDKMVNPILSHNRIGRVVIRTMTCFAKTASRSLNLFSVTGTFLIIYSVSSAYSNEKNQVEFEVLRRFELAAFGFEYDNGGIDRNRVQKFTPGLVSYRVYRSSKTTKEHQRTIDELFGTVDMVLSGNSFVNAMFMKDGNSKAKAQVHIQFFDTKTEKAKFTRQIAGINMIDGETSHCEFLFDYDLNSGAIQQSIIFISLEANEEIVNNCIYTEIIQSLGMPNDSDELKQSLFNNDPSPNCIPRHDLMSLALLYHRDIPIGIDKDEAMKIAASISFEVVSSLSQLFDSDHEEIRRKLKRLCE